MNANDGSFRLRFGRKACARFYDNSCSILIKFRITNVIVVREDEVPRWRINPSAASTQERRRDNENGLDFFSLQSPAKPGKFPAHNFVRHRFIRLLLYRFEATAVIRESDT